MTEKELRQNYVNAAAAYVGAQKGTSKHHEIIDTYNTIKPLPRSYKVTYTDAWCATTVSAMAKKCNLLDIIPAECSCYYMIEGFKKLNRWVENDAYVPNTGDIIFYDWDDSGSGDDKGAPEHVGIVESVSNGTITVIEGNKGSPSQVGRRYIAVNGRYIRGFGIPNYASKATKETPKTEVKAAEAPKAAPKAVEAPKAVKPAIVPEIGLPTLKKGSKNEYVRALQYLLGYFGYACGTIDGDFGEKTDAALKKFQKAKKLEVDGVCGVNTWTTIRNLMPEIKYGSYGNVVGALQTLLNLYGFSCCAVDKDFGKNTKKAVLKYQDARGLIEDAIVGKETWKMVFKGK